MIFREATVDDIDNYMIVRMLVKENKLNNPALVTKADNIAYLTTDGKGWVCEIAHQIVGFAIVGLLQKNVWALFVHPDYEQLGIGTILHTNMLKWYFEQTQETIWLGTDPETKAAKFYRNKGWVEVGRQGGEIKFEMCFEDWKNH